MNLPEVSAKSGADLDEFHTLTREWFNRQALAELRDRKDATSRCMLTAIILYADSVQSALRRLAACSAAPTKAIARGPTCRGQPAPRQTAMCNPSQRLVRPTIGGDPPRPRLGDFFVAIGFSSDAQTEREAFRRKPERIIKLITVQDIPEGVLAQKCRPGHDAQTPVLQPLATAARS